MSETSSLDNVAGRLSEKNVSNAEIDSLLARVRSLVASYGGKDGAVMERLQAKASAIENMGAAKKDNKVIDYHNPVEVLGKINGQDYPFMVEKTATEYLKQTMPAMDVLRDKKDKGILFTEAEQKVWEETLNKYKQIASLYPHKVKETNSYTEGHERESRGGISGQNSRIIPNRARG